MSEDTFVMSESYFRAKFFWLCDAVDAPFRARPTPPGESVQYATEDEIEAQSADEALLGEAMVGKPVDQAPDIYEELRSKLRTQQLREADAETVRHAFCGFR